MSHESYTPFLNSDFTYSDLRFVSTGPTLTLAGEAERDGVKCRLVQAIPKETWAYARSVTCIAVDSHLPVERQIFDPTNTLWKVQRWGRPTLIDGVPSIMTMSMEDVQAKTRTDVSVGAIHYGVTIPDELFAPASLGTAADAPILNGIVGGSAPK
jgi:hypothetical protein